MKRPILLFAAGLGTRMGALVQDRPKPLVEVAGKPLIDHAMEFTGISEIGTRVVNLHYKADMMRHHLRDQDVVFSDETGELMETGGGLKKALPLLDASPVVTMNTDAVWSGPNPIQQILSAWHDDMEALLLLVPKDRVFGHQGGGDFEVDASGRLTRGPGDVYTGVQIVRTDGLHDIEERAFSMNLLWDKIAQRGGLFGTRYDGQWCDVGQPKSIAIAERMLKNHTDV